MSQRQLEIYDYLLDMYRTKVKYLEKERDMVWEKMNPLVKLEDLEEGSPEYKILKFKIETYKSIQQEKEDKIRNYQQRDKGNSR